MAAVTLPAGAREPVRRDAIRRKVLVTGAAGNIGRYFAEHARGRYDLRLLERSREDADKAGLSEFGEVVIADVGDREAMAQACEGIDTILHLAANPSPSAVWQSLLEVNIVGTYNTFVAAKAAGCRRVIYASSIHAVSGYPADVQVKTSEPVNPGDLYGVSKCFGEALARYMAEQEGLSSVAIRIGAFQPEDSAASEGGVSFMDAWVSQRDLQQLIELAIDAEPLTFCIVNGISNNRFKRLDISDARRILGYQPQDDLTEINPALAPLQLDERVDAHNVQDEGQKSGLRKELAQ
jgi:nucleoside-diphosphate-sugar epimerase